MRKTVHLATKRSSFEAAADRVGETLEISLTTKRVERLTERVGWERVAERDETVAGGKGVPLMNKLAGPPGGPAGAGGGGGWAAGRSGGGGAEPGDRGRGGGGGGGVGWEAAPHPTAPPLLLPPPV